MIPTGLFFNALIVEIFIVMVLLPTVVYVKSVFSSSSVFYVRLVLNMFSVLFVQNTLEKIIYESSKIVH